MRMTWRRGRILSLPLRGVLTLHASVSSNRMLVPFTRCHSHKNGEFKKFMMQMSRRMLEEWTARREGGSKACWGEQAQGRIILGFLWVYSAFSKWITFGGKSVTVRKQQTKGTTWENLFCKCHAIYTVQTTDTAQGLLTQRSSLTFRLHNADQSNCNCTVLRLKWEIKIRIGQLFVKKNGI